MPPATLVVWALPSILPRMMSCLGPQAFFQRPMISTGTASASVPLKTVQAVAFIPGLISLDLRISTLPALGRCGVAGQTATEYSNTAVKRRAGAHERLCALVCMHIPSNCKISSYLHYDPDRQFKARPCG